MLHAKETKNIPFALLPDSVSTPLRAPGGFNQSVAICHGYVIAMLLHFDASSVNQSLSQSVKLLSTIISMPLEHM